MQKLSPRHSAKVQDDLAAKGDRMSTAYWIYPHSGAETHADNPVAVKFHLSRDLRTAW